jgi:glycosyltransferase involved in cell wall biosynthesis
MLMDISVICGRLDDNTLVRSYLLLKTLPEASVTVYGPADSGKLYPFFERDAVDFEILPVSQRIPYVRQFINIPRLWRFLRRNIGSTDLLYFASGWKHTILPGLATKFGHYQDVPSLLDIYDYTPWFDQVPMVNPPELFDAVIASNEPLARSVDGQTVYTPVDTDRFDPGRFDKHSIQSELGIASDEFVAGFIGTPRPEKGVDHLVDAVDGSETDVRGLIVGAGKGGYAGELRSRASDQTVFVEPVPHSEIPKYYAAIDVLVLAQQTSSFGKYQMPAKLFEAMSMAKPVIVTDIGDLPEVVGKTGEVITEPSTEALKEAFKTLRQGNIAQKGHEARKRACGRYSERVIGQQLQSIIDNLVH